jgi:hypothetical protein
VTRREAQGYNNVMATATGTHEYTAPEVSRRSWRLLSCLRSLLGAEACVPTVEVCADS